MATKLRYKMPAAILLAFLLSTPAQAQLSQVFEDVFTNILGSEERKGALASVKVPPDFLEDHANHFIPASKAANGILVPALNRLIASNVSSFPLNSTSAGIQRFDFSTGQPVAVKGSLGPIFAESGRTLGKGKLHAGMNYSSLTLTKFRGMKTEDIKFSFTHEDVDSPGLGESAQESDVVDIVLDLSINANVFSFYATYGLTDNLDISVALPVLNISLNGNARATINSFSLIKIGRALHHFGADGAPVTDEPVLEYIHSYDASAFGIGDLALRLKYAFLRKPGIDLAALIDVRLPTGRSEDFLGTGSTNGRLSLIASKQFGDFTPHLNAGYEYRGAAFDSDEFEFAAGFDQKLLSGLTFALSILGEVDLNNSDILNFEYSPTPIIITDHVNTQKFNDDGTPNPSYQEGELTRTIEQTNIPARTNDNVFNASLGFRYAPADNVILLGNILLPLNDGGLRSDIAYTLGFAFTF